MPPADKSRTGPRAAQVPQYTVGDVTPRGGAAQVANHLGDKRRQRGVAGEVVCVVDATAPPGASLAREPPTMRVNPVTRTPTPRYAPGRRRRACHQPPTRIRGPTRESADPRADRGPAPVIADPGAKCRIHVRGEERRQLARSEQFRMQFDWVNFQQYLQTLQSQRYGCAVRHSVGGIACDIRGIARRAGVMRCNP